MKTKWKKCLPFLVIGPQKIRHYVKSIEKKQTYSKHDGKLRKNNLQNIFI